MNTWNKLPIMMAVGLLAVIGVPLWGASVGASQGPASVPVFYQPVEPDLVRPVQPDLEDAKYQKDISQPVTKWSGRNGTFRKAPKADGTIPGAEGKILALPTRAQGPRLHYPGSALTPRTRMTLSGWLYYWKRVSNRNLDVPPYEPDPGPVPDNWGGGYDCKVFTTWGPYCSVTPITVDHTTTFEESRAKTFERMAWNINVTVAEVKAMGTPSAWGESIGYAIGEYVHHGNKVYEAVSRSQKVEPGTDSAKWNRVPDIRDHVRFLNHSDGITRTRWDYPDTDRMKAQLASDRATIEAHNARQRELAVETIAFDQDAYDADMLKYEEDLAAYNAVAAAYLQEDERFKRQRQQYGGMHVVCWLTHCGVERAVR